MLGWLQYFVWWDGASAGASLVGTWSNVAYLEAGGEPRGIHAMRESRYIDAAGEPRDIGASREPRDIDAAREPRGL